MAKLILAPNAFKESLSPSVAAAAMRKGARCADPHLIGVELPIADGGNGTVEALVHAVRGQTETVRVRGPLGSSVDAVIGWFPDQTTAVLEVASACGIHLVPEHLRSPINTQTVGVGELLLRAIDQGAKRVLVGLGGSATNDGGIGFAHALGYRFIDQNDRVLPPIAGSLAQVATIDASSVDSRLKKLVLDIACDVANPLCGPQGASAIFGPQKGASLEMVAELDRALAHFATVIEKSLGISVANVPGAGAAGGLGAAMIAFASGRLQSGIDLILDACGFDEHVRDADLCLTGEGSLDDSTIHGKAIAGIARRCQKAGVPVIALVGQLQASPAVLSQLGITAAFSICPGPCRLEEAKQHAEHWLAQTTEQVVRTFFSTRST